MLVAGGSYAVQRLEFVMAVARLKPSPTPVKASPTEVTPGPSDAARLKPSPTDAKPSPTDVTPSARDQNARAAHAVVLALQIASAKVSAAQAKVQEMTHHERHNDY